MLYNTSVAGVRVVEFGTDCLLFRVLYNAAALSRPRDGDQQRRHCSHTCRSVDDHPRMQHPHIDSSVAVLPVHRGQRPAKFADGTLIHICGKPAAALPLSCCRPASIVGCSVQRHHLLKLILQSTTDESQSLLRFLVCCQKLLSVFEC